MTESFSSALRSCGGSNGPTAVQEQLGLNLEPARGPVNVLVIDRAEQLTTEK